MLQKVHVATIYILNTLTFEYSVFSLQLKVFSTIMTLLSLISFNTILSIVLSYKFHCCQRLLDNIKLSIINLYYRFPQCSLKCHGHEISVSHGTNFQPLVYVVGCGLNNIYNTIIPLTCFCRVELINNKTMCLQIAGCFGKSSYLCMKCCAINQYILSVLQKVATK